MDIETCQYVGFSFFFSGLGLMLMFTQFVAANEDKKRRRLELHCEWKNIFFTRGFKKAEQTASAWARGACLMLGVHDHLQYFYKDCVEQLLWACCFFAKFPTNSCFACGTSNASACICVLLESRHCRIVHMFFIGQQSGCTTAGCRNLYRPGQNFNATWVETDDCYFRNSCERNV